MSCGVVRCGFVSDFAPFVVGLYLIYAKAVVPPSRGSVSFFLGVVSCLVVSPFRASASLPLIVCRAWTATTTVVVVVVLEQRRRSSERTTEHNIYVYALVLVFWRLTDRPTDLLESSLLLLASRLVLIPLKCFFFSMVAPVAVFCCFCSVLISFLSLLCSCLFFFFFPPSPEHDETRFVGPTHPPPSPHLFVPRPIFLAEEPRVKKTRLGGWGGGAEGECVVRCFF